MNFSIYLPTIFSFSLNLHSRLFLLVAIVKIIFHYDLLNLPIFKHKHLFPTQRMVINYTIKYLYWGLGQ